MTVSQMDGLHVGLIIFLVGSTVSLLVSCRLHHMTLADNAKLRRRLDQLSAKVSADLKDRVDRLSKGT